MREDGQARPVDRPASDESSTHAAYRPPTLAAILLEGAPVRTCFRYRTCALVGPWRARPEDARSDALRACQARIDDAGGFSWTVAGWIEAGSRALQNGADQN